MCKDSINEMEQREIELQHLLNKHAIAQGWNGIEDILHQGGKLEINFPCHSNDEVIGAILNHPAWPRENYFTAPCAWISASSDDKVFLHIAPSDEYV